MKLFSSAAAAMIEESAKKSKAALAPPPKVNSSKLFGELPEISKKVQEYFKGSPAILISTEEELHDYISHVIDAGYCGIDTETTGLDRVKDYIVGTSLYYPEGVECYIPIRHRIPLLEEPYKGQLTYEQVRKEYQRLADNKVKLIFANADFDLAMIYKDLKVDFSDTYYYDVILAWRCLKENEKDNALKVLYNKYVLKGHGDPMKFNDFFSPTLFPYCDPKVAKLYAANDAKITYELFKWQLPYVTKSHPKCQKHHLEAISDLIWNVEMPLIKVCHHMHRSGIYLDKKVADRLNTRYQNKYLKELKKLHELVQAEIEKSDYSTYAKRPFAKAQDFNPSSPVHVKYLIYTMMKIPAGKNGGGTGKEVLADLNLPVTNQILKVRSLLVLINTFVKKLPAATTLDSRIHAQFKQIGADCIVGDSIVPTNKGYFTMYDLCESRSCIDSEHVDVDDLVILNKDQKFESASSVIRYTDYPTIKITTEMGFELEGTPNHPVMVSKYSAKDHITRGDKRLDSFWDDRRFKNLEEISVGDFIEIPCNYSVSAAYQSTQLVKCPYSKRSGKSSEHITIPNTYSEEFALFLGMYHADGSAGLREGTYTIALANDDEDVIEMFRNLSKKLFNLSISVYDKQRDLHEVESYISCICIQDIDKILSHGKQNKQIPAAIWRSPTSVINAYIKGMTLDSSVYIDENGRAALELSICKGLDARFIQMHLASQGILSHMSYNENQGWRSPRLVFNADNYTLFRDTIGFIESRKYVETSPCFRNKYDARRIGDSFRVKVKKIESSVNTVYDLHVPGTHSFISNGMISHNTGRLSSADPNMQNIPSHATDIRHLFRATASHDEIVDCSYDESLNTVTVHVGKFNTVTTPAGDIAVKDLSVGDSVKLIEDGKECWKDVKAISTSDEDLCVCDVVF